MRAVQFFVAGCCVGLFFLPRAEAALYGVDVSHWQGYVNWTSMSNDGITFAFAKATEGVDFVDSQFTNNMTNARNAGVPLGPYHFARPDSNVGTLSDPVKQDAVNEANDFVDAIEPYYTNYPGQYLRPVLDVEALPSSAEINTTAEKKQYLSDWIRDFNNVVQTRLGTDVIIYTGGYYSQTYYESDLASFDLWFAAPNGLSNPPSSSSMGIWNAYDFWQYSWTENIGGESPVDANYFQGTTADLQAFVYDPASQGLQGDFNDDGVVDAADYTVWRDNFNDRFPVPGNPADANDDSFVNGADYAIWQAHYGETAPPPSAAVPEPAALVLALLGVSFLLRKSRYVA